MKDVKKTLVGLVENMPTPFKSNYEVDVEGLRSNTRWYIEKGIKTGTGVLKAAVMVGDFYQLTNAERKLVIKTVVEAADGDVPVYAGAGSTSTKESVELAQYAEKVGADGLQISPPYYYPPTDEMIYRHYKEVSDNCSLPIVVYNVSELIGRDISVELMRRLLELENVKAVKWGNTTSEANFIDMLDEFADKTIIIINSSLKVLGHMKGARGFIPSFASFWPEWDLKLWKLLENHQYEEAEKHQETFHVYRRETAKIRAENKDWGTSVRRAAMELAGRPAGPPRPPQIPLTAAQKEKLKALLKKLGCPNIED